MALIWQFVSENVRDIIIPIITLVGGLVIGSFSERNRERQRRLKVHFEEIKREAETNIISGISGVSEHSGRVVIYDGHNEYATPIELPKPSESFATHLPEETSKLADYGKNINKHNKIYEAFRLKVTNSFKSKAVDVVNINDKTSCPHIWDNIFWLLFEWWLDRHQSKVPHFDFGQIEVTKDFGPHNLLVAGCNSQAVAYAETEESKEKCKSVIWEVADNQEFEREAVEIINSAHGLEKEIKTLAKELSDKLDNIYKFELWRGRRRKFVIQKKCPLCQKYV
jgi:hypothetical protein